MAKVNKPSFVAIAVGQGDAFFLDKSGFTALIDGGRSTYGFPTQFQRVTKRDGVDILICTHNDADHALGVLGFLRSGLAAKEIWLPGSWTDRLEDLLLKQESFTEELLSNISGMEVSTEKRPSLQDLGDRYSETMKSQEKEGEVGTSTDALLEDLERAGELRPYGDVLGASFPSLGWLPGGPPGWWYELRHWIRGDEGKFQLFVEAVSAGTLIREISLAAYHMGATIRWFEFDSMPNSEGISSALVPLNAHEIHRRRPHPRGALAYLALTTTNKQSLVFISPANDEEPAVLFTADSDLSFSQPIPWSDGMIITAPHHGSEANAHTYKRFISEASDNLDVFWVRSDGRFSARPGSWYLKLKTCETCFCTLCRGSNHPKQDVRLECASRKWKPVSTRECRCV